MGGRTSVGDYVSTGGLQGGSMAGPDPVTHPAPTIRVGPTTSTFGLYCALCGERLRRAERGIYCDHPRLPYVQDDPQRDVWHLACAAQLSHALAAEVRRAEMPARGPQ